MSESIGKPWIESSVVEILVDHGHELPSPSKLQGRAQIVKFLTFREDTGDGSQPKDRDTVLWAEITDGEWIMPVRIANEATNKIEDEYKRALTHYRRGFFTLKASVSFDFIRTQVGKTQTKLSPLKQLYLDISELHYISGGGEGAPVATRATALQTPPAFNKWVSGLNTGGQTLTNLQAQEKIVKDILRSSRVNSRRSNATGASKRLSKGPVKTPVQSVTPQTSIGNLAAKREWQEGWFGKRPKFHGVDYIPHPGGFELTADQQAKFEAILERVKMATPNNPYDPTNMDSNSSVPDRSSVPSTFRSSQTIRSSQVIRPSQVISSTPIDTRLPRSNPVGPQLPIPEEVDEPVDLSSDGDSNEDSDSDHAGPIRSQRAQKSAMNQTNRVGHPRCHIPTPRPSDPRADENHEASDGAEDEPRSLETDDEITEQVLSQAEPIASGSRREGAATVLVPDSDPPNPSQRPTQVRHSSPWDCEDGLPSERDISYSPEANRRSPAKGKRQLSPILSSPSRPGLDASRDESMNSQPVGQAMSNTKQQGTSGLGESQPSAAASLPSPPPEDSNSQKADAQHLDPLLSRRADEIPPPAPTLPHPRESSPQRDLKNSLNKQQEDAFETRPRVDKLASRKRRLSQSQEGSTPHSELSQELAPSVSGRPATENKRRRLDGSNVPTSTSKNASRQSNVAREGSVTRFAVSSNSTKPAISNNNAGIIPHDHDAWTNPSWMNNAPHPKQVKPTPIKSARTSDVLPLDKPLVRRIPRPSTGLRILQPPFHHPTRIVERHPSPEFPPFTASQFADADEDSGVASSKVEPPTPARPNKPIAAKPRISNAAPLKPIPRDQPATSVAGHPKQPRATGKAIGISTRVPQGHDHTVRNGGHTPEGQVREGKSTRRLTIHSTSNNSGTRLDNSSADVAQSYLGGFQPSITVDFPQKYQLTWEKWLEVTKDAYSFWLE